MSENDADGTRRTIRLEPHWEGLRAWAEHGLRGPCTPRERKAFREILKQCDIAQGKVK